MTARDKIEPAALVDESSPYGVSRTVRSPTEREVEQSKAISLRRIADALETLALSMQSN